MKFFILALISIVPLAAQANEYEYWSLNCRLSGRSQTIYSPAKKFSKRGYFQANFATPAGTQDPIQQSVKVTVLSPRQEWLGAPAMRFSARSLCGEKPAISLSGTLSPELAEKYVRALGVESFPEMTRSDALNGEGQFALNALQLGIVDCGYSWKTQNLGGDLAQIHFSYDNWQGLSYHLSLESCIVKRIDVKGQTHRQGD